MGTSVSRRPRISLVVHDFSTGYGQGRYCTELSTRLAGHFEFSVVAASFTSDPLSNLRSFPVPAWRRNVATTIVSFLARCGGPLRESRPDLIHAQGLTCWNTDLITAHVCNAARLHHMAGSRLKARLFTQLVAPLEKAFYGQRQARRVIGISRVVAEEIRQHYRWRRPVDVIYHGTDVERFRPPISGERESLRSELAVPAESWLWLFMGEAEKGLRDVIAQLPQFPSARLLVVSRSRLVPYRAEAERLGVVGRIHFHGPDPRPERLHRVADVLVYPSRYDTFAMVVAEAMASGVPVVVGQRVGAAELIEDGRNGLLCDPDSTETISRPLRQLQAAPDWARQIGQAGRRTIERHTWAECAEATARVYEQILREKHDRSAA
jgi:glycosyltransferase involved in cell wall biosynthesis